MEIETQTEHRQSIALSLSRLLADEVILQTKTKKAHWNIEGTDFMGKHSLFEEHYKKLESLIDSVAERIRVVGHYAPGTLKEYLQLSQLTENSRASNTGTGFIKELYADHNGIIVFIKSVVGKLGNEFNDLGTLAFLTSVIETHEKMAWILKSHITEAS